MLKRIVLAAALAASTGAALATTTIGGATLIDTATVINGTVNPTTFLTYVSGGDATIGTADGSAYTITSSTATAAQAAAAMANADHQWLQFDPVIVMHSNTALNGVIAIPAIDHGWAAGNTGEFWEPFEFIIYGCSGATFTSLTACEQGHITRVWTQGVDNTTAAKNADDWSSEWDFNGSYTTFVISSGDRLVHAPGAGPFSPGEGEIDALAAAPIPEPETYALFAAGLAAMAFMARRQRRRP